MDSLIGAVFRTLAAHPFAGPTLIRRLRPLNKTTTAKHPLMFATANLVDRGARTSLRVLQDRQAAMKCLQPQLTPRFLQLPSLAGRALPVE